MDVHIVKEIIWKKRLEELDEDPNYTYFEGQYDQIFPLNVDSIIMRMHSKCATTRNTPYI